MYNNDNKSDNKKNITPALYLVPTPIGNLEDITMRAVNILQEADFIACEDTRRSGVLIKSLGLSTKAKLISYFEHNENEKNDFLINKIIDGNIVALISDAGSPCISDPGYKLVQKAIEKNVKIISLPGATACIPALTASGFPVHRFTFFGFPPQKKGRQSFIKSILNCPNTAIVYESSHRIIKFINEIVSLDSNRNICIAREISKIYEEYIRFNTNEFNNNTINITEKGEFVIIIEGKDENKEDLV